MRTSGRCSGTTMRSVRTTWPHGGFGTFIAEPVGSTYHDPKTGKQIRSGPIADIRTNEPVGSRREQQLPRIDGAGARHRAAHRQYRDGGQSSRTADRSGAGGGQDRLVHDAGEDLHDADAVPERRDAHDGQRLKLPGRADRAAIGDQPGCRRRSFNSQIHGDPYTPLLRAYTGDTMVFRLLHTLMNETMTWTLSGHTFLSRALCGRCESEELHPYRHCRAV